jgi:ribose 5-phosphate isomerase B
MRIAIGADHGGYTLKTEIIDFLVDRGYQVFDQGTHSEDSVDYPDFAEQVAYKITDGQADRGILICGSGVGVCIAANKIKGIYAAICHDSYSAKQGVEHDHMNVLCLGGRVIGAELAKVLVAAFLDAKFIGKEQGEERHLRRTNKIKSIEEKEL